MTKYLILILFLFISIALIRRDRIYVIPIILVIYSNINGLLDWEDFAFKGLIKFQDYGLIITFVAIFLSSISKSNNLSVFVGYKKNILFRVLLVYWLYYAFLFVYSILIQGDVEWPVKMGRTFFYGMIIFLIANEAERSNPIESIEKMINALKYFTLLFGCFYVAYNIGGFDVYPKDEYESFVVAGIGEIKRNFTGFPTFTFYFLIFFLDKLLKDENRGLQDIFGVLLMMACIALTLTRGAILTMIAVVLITLMYRVPTASAIRRSIGFAAIFISVLPFLIEFGRGHLEVLTLRFGEFVDGGITQSGNLLARASEFSTILVNVLDFNPAFGFGFTNVAEFGYQSNLIHGGSADNGFSNLIGVTGFVGLVIFGVIIISWILVNLKLQSLRQEALSKVNFIFIGYMIASFLNGASMSYMHSYGLFMVYDLMALSYLAINSRSKAVNV